MRCRECSRSFPARMLHTLVINNTKLDGCCPICALNIRNAVYGYKRHTPFEGLKAREIYDEARKIYPKGPFLSYEWEDLAHIMGLFEARGVQRGEMQKAYYAGAAAFFHLMMEETEKGDEGLNAFLQSASGELRNFHEFIQILAKEQSNAQATNGHSKDTVPASEGDLRRDDETPS